MAWEPPAESRPVWCAAGDEKPGTPTAENVDCTTKDPAGSGAEIALLQLPASGAHGPAAEVNGGSLPASPSYKKFTSQDELGHFLLDHYKIRTPKDLTSCEVCHR
jgi:hypothetical protein